MEAQVYKSTGSWYIIKTDDGHLLNARIKGVLKIDGITSTNPIAVGDRVKVELESETEKSAMITGIHDRRNYIARQSPANRNQHHIVAANLDQALMLATLKDPKTSQGFIDRFLITCEAYHIPALIVFNKSDLYRKKEMAKFEELQEMYEDIGYVVSLVSVEKEEGIDELSEHLKGKTTLISGHSGVGKSSFINLISPKLNLRTKDVSGWSGKGMHTTTFAEMFDVDEQTKIIDTPGMREFGLFDMNKQELSHYYPEMRQLINECEFNNCLHINEPGCAIKEAVNEGTVHVERYVSYATILDSIEEKKY